MRLDISFLIALISTISLSYFQAVNLSKANCLSILCHRAALSCNWSKLFKSIHSFSERSFWTLSTYWLSTSLVDNQSISQKYLTATLFSSSLYFIIALWASTFFQTSGKYCIFTISLNICSTSFLCLSTNHNVSAKSVK